jgi:hypothetical protein
MYAERNKTPPEALVVNVRVKTRNDTEFNDRAYKLAERIDLTYLVTSFDPANFSRDKTIVLDEDGEGRLEAAISSELLEIAKAQESSNPIVELTPAQRRQQAKDYAAYMKRLYEEEMGIMMDQLVDKLPNKLASKVRKALAAKKHRMKMKRRQEFINRRRKIEQIRPEQLDFLVKFHEMQTIIPGEQLTDSSSEDEAKKAKADRKAMKNLLGDLANLDEAQMKAMLESRAAVEAAEQAERDSIEAKRSRR